MIKKDLYLTLFVLVYAVEELMRKWEFTKYLISAKKDVDSLLFIHNNLNYIPIALRMDYVDRIRDHFYINCCVVVDHFLDDHNIMNTKTESKRTEWKKERPLIESLFYERDKNSAHIDETYRSKHYESFLRLIKEMKMQIKAILQECSDCLPDNIVIDYFPHDKVLFRLINKISISDEDEINKSKYVDHKEGFAIGNLSKPRQVVYDIKELRGLTKEEKQNLAVTVDAGLNFYEAQQNLQDFYILVNDIHDFNLWTYNVADRCKVYEKLKSTGIIDQYDRPRKNMALSTEFVNNVYEMANYIWGYGFWTKVN